MAKFTPHMNINYSVTVTLTEVEARALDALFGYNNKQMLDVFYEHMGKYYMEPHEAGFFSLAESVRTQLQDGLGRVNEAQKVISGDSIKAAHVRGLFEALEIVKASVTEDGKNDTAEDIQNAIDEVKDPTKKKKNNEAT